MTKFKAHLLHAIAFVCAFSLSNSYAQVPNFQWLKTIQGTSSDDRNRLVEVGNLCDVWTEVISSSGGFHSEIRRYNANGNLVYSTNIPASYPNIPETASLVATVQDIESDSELNLYHTGSVRINQNNYLYIEKLSPTGASIWKFYQVPISSSTNSSYGYDLDVEGNSLYLAGEYFEGVHFSNTDLLQMPPNTIGSSSFLVKMDTSGIVQWKRSFPLTNPLKIAADNAGNVFMTGSCNSAITLNGITVSPGNILAKFNNQGVCTQLKNVVYGLVSDFICKSNGELVIAGISDNSNQGIFNATYDTNLNLINMRSLPVIYLCVPSLIPRPTVKLDNIGATYIIIPNDVSLAGATDAVNMGNLYKYDPNGVLSWSKEDFGQNINGNDNIFNPVSVAANDNGNLAIGGSYLSSYGLSVDNLVVNASVQNQYSAFVAAIKGDNVSCNTAIANHTESINWQVYPNPNEGNFLLKSLNPLTEIQQIIIFNATGKKVYQENFDKTHEMEYSFSLKLPAGIYAIRLQSKEGESVQKVIIQ